jgi:hypothetical protein
MLSEEISRYRAAIGAWCACAGAWKIPEPEICEAIRTADTMAGTQTSRKT